MGEFIAKERLEPEDFKKFSGQCVNDHERALRRLSESRADLAEAQRSADFWQSRVVDSVAYCAKHGVSLNAV